MVMIAAGSLLTPYFQATTPNNEGRRPAALSSLQATSLQAYPPLPRQSIFCC
jgi:hypothetical protein